MNKNEIMTREMTAENKVCEYSRLSSFSERFEARGSSRMLLTTIYGTFFKTNINYYWLILFYVNVRAKHKGKMMHSNVTTVILVAKLGARDK